MTKAVIWGHPLYSHTNSYVFSSFVKAFKHLGYETYWLTDKDDVSGMDFSDTIFFAEHQDDKNMPKRADCKYILHNCPSERYAHIPISNKLNLQVYRASCPEHNASQYSAQKLDDGVFYSDHDRTLYQPWATNLLPYEINLDDAGMTRVNECHWVGTIGGFLYGNINEIDPFKRACQEKGINFIQHASISDDDHKHLIQRSYMAPAIHGAWQCKNGYVADRLFKNISYGHLGITNCPAAQDMFKGELVYNQDTYQMFHDALPHTCNTERIRQQMQIIREKHTYVNRIKTILSVL